MLAELNSSIKEFKPKIDPSDYEGEEGSYDVCIANISPKERRMRLNYGIGQLVFGFILLAILLVKDVDTLWRLPLFIVFASGAVSCFQSFDKT